MRRRASWLARCWRRPFLPDWIDEVFETHRRYQYARELLFSIVVELMTLVGARPAPLAARRGAPERDPARVADRALRTRSTARSRRCCAPWCRPAPRVLPRPWRSWSSKAILPGWQVRVLDGNHFPGTEKRVAPLHGHRGAALPGQAVVVYDPDSGLVLRHGGGRGRPSNRARPGRHAAKPGQGRDRYGSPTVTFCTRAPCWKAGTRRAPASWRASTPTIPVSRSAAHGATVAGSKPARCASRPSEWRATPHPWRCVELTLDMPTEAGDTVIRIWSNLPGHRQGRADRPHLQASLEHRGGCSGGWSACCTARSRAWGSRAPPAWPLRPRCWPTTCSPL